MTRHRTIKEKASNESNQKVEGFTEKLKKPYEILCTNEDIGMQG
jgi:hypothetical protein